MANTKYIDEDILPFFEEKDKSWKKLDQPLQTIVYENAYILPSKGNAHPYKGGVVDVNQKIVKECKMLSNRQVEAYNFNTNQALYDDREVIYIGCFWSHWGHFITDQMSRVYALLKEENSSLPIAYIGRDGLTPRQIEFFTLLDINPQRLIKIEKPTQFKKVHVPQASFNFGTYWAEEFRFVYEKIRSNVEKDENYPKKIFLSRGEFKKAKTRDLGEIKEIENLFKSNGYAIIYPETLPLREQIKYLKSCDEIVATSGSISHNILFAEPNTKITILNRSYVFNSMQSALNEIAKAEVVNVDAQLSFVVQHVGLGPFYYHFTKQLIEYAKDNNLNFEFPKKHNYLNIYYLNAFRAYLDQIRNLDTMLLKKNKPFFKKHLKKARGGFFSKIIIEFYNNIRTLLIPLWFVCSLVTPFSSYGRKMVRAKQEKLKYVFLLKFSRKFL